MHTYILSQIDVFYPVLSGTYTLNYSPQIKKFSFDSEPNMNWVIACLFNTMFWCWFWFVWWTRFCTQPTENFVLQHCWLEEISYSFKYFVSGQTDGIYR